MFYVYAIGDISIGATTNDLTTMPSHNGTSSNINNNSKANSSIPGQIINNKSFCESSLKHISDDKSNEKAGTQERCSSPENNTYSSRNRYHASTESIEVHDEMSNKSSKKRVASNVNGEAKRTKSNNIAQQPSDSYSNNSASVDSNPQLKIG
jgi:hypothetical protein